MDLTLKIRRFYFLIFFLAGIQSCCREETARVLVYQDIDFKGTFGPNLSANSDTLLHESKSLTCSLSKKTGNQKDSIIEYRDCRTTLHKDMVTPADINRDPIVRFELFANRKFDQFHPVGTNLTDYLFSLSHPFEKFSSDLKSFDKSYSSSFFFVGLPDTVKGPIVFEWVATTKKGLIFRDSTVAFLK